LNASATPAHRTNEAVLAAKAKVLRVKLEGLPLEADGHASLHNIANVNSLDSLGRHELNGCHAIRELEEPDLRKAVGRESTQSCI